MPTERIQRRIDALLDEAEASMSAGDWSAVAEKARAVLGMNPGNEDATAFLNGAEPNLAAPSSSAATSTPTPPPAPTPATAGPAQPESFAAGRYHVRKFLGEGGKKRVFLAHDALLDRDVAFALIKTEGLDATGRERITREAQAMGRMGTHPHVVTIFEIGEEGGAPYVVTELLGGGDVEGMLEKAGGTVSLARALQVAKDVCDGLVFAHAQGIVHRDLKPGNVWLTAEGVAKIGDFGLAVNLGRSRLTQHGLMVGTVAYMPPEQALGGEVTPQSDLYSLGAMLYELVTGKPPFQADDPTAVISQHINIAPVAPSWNTAHCPPDLERLILQLLAKAPQERPKSAGEVLVALGRVDPNAKSASHSDSSANPLDRLARGVFVGRERELERLRGAFDNAFAGHGSVLMLVGEPGIGKTRAAQEAETYARIRGAQVLWGRAHESAGAPPYFPWVQIARSYRAQNSDEVRRKEWGPYAVELQRIFPGLRDLFPNLPEPPAIESEEAQFQLFDAMSGFLRDVSERAPVMLVLDDLHWADRPTLLMLTHLAREIAHSRILVVGTYRDTDLDRTHSLSQTLAELNREQLFTRIALRGLGRDEVAAYIGAVTHLDPPAALVARIHEETEGNPFFLGEVVNLMAQEGTLARAGNTSISDLAIPEGVKEALGRRLDRLSPEANSLLQLAAIAGREFDHALLVALTGKDDEAVLALVEEALAGRVIEETGTVGAYRFTHALMQETLAGELSAARQVRLHGQIAEALERVYGENTEANAAQLAEHYVESAVLNRAHAQKAARYSRLAAEQAQAQFAWDEAIRHYQRCLSIVQETPDRLGEDEAGLWLELAVVEGSARGERGQQLASFDRARTLYAERDDPVGAARAWSRMTSFWQQTQLRPRLPALDQTLVALGAGDSAERCWLLALRARADYGPEGDADAREAERIAEALHLQGDAYPADLLTRNLVASLEQGRFSEVVAAAPAVAARFIAAGQDATQALNFGRAAALYMGDIDEAERAAREWGAYGQRRRNWVEYAAQSVSARIAKHRNGPGLYDQTLPEIPRGTNFAADLFRAELALTSGEPRTALLQCPTAASNDETTSRYRLAGLRARILLALGDYAAATVEFDAWLAGWRSDLSTTNIPLTGLIEMLGDGVCELADSVLREELLTYLGRYPLMRAFSWESLSNPDHLRGLLALSLDRPDEAEQHFDTGLEWASRPNVRFVIDQGRCHQGLAEVAEQRGDHSLSMEHLDAAGALFAQHGAKLYLDQVLAKKQFLKA